MLFSPYFFSSSFCLNNSIIFFCFFTRHYDKSESQRAKGKFMVVGRHKRSIIFLEQKTLVIMLHRKTNNKYVHTFYCGMVPGRKKKLANFLPSLQKKKKNENEERKFFQEFPFSYFGIRIRRRRRALLHAKSAKHKKRFYCIEVKIEVLHATFSSCLGCLLKK